MFSAVAELGLGVENETSDGASETAGSENEQLAVLALLAEVGNDNGPRR